MALTAVVAASGCGTAAFPHQRTQPTVVTRAESTSTAPPVATIPTTTTTSTSSTGPDVVRVVLVGDVMLGRGVAPVIRRDPDSVFAAVTHVLRTADLAGANLESPLTTRAHIAANPYALEADPAAARLLATAGFDVLSVANNHSGDAGRLSILDTLEAVGEAGMVTAGAGRHRDGAYTPAVLERNGLTVAFLAFDATLAGTPATPEEPGVAHWIPDLVQKAVEESAAMSDLLVVSLHGGIEYADETDPGMAALAEDLAAWGADVVWGHGPHVVQPVYRVEGAGGRPVVVATSLGNFLFDQSSPGTRRGALLEVLADDRGVIAYRRAITGHADLRLAMEGWELPEGDAGLIGLDWWNLVRRLEEHPAPRPILEGFPWGDVVDASLGNVVGDREPEMVVSHRHPFRSNEINSHYPDLQWVDARGRSAHLGVYRPESLEPIWVAGSLFRPIARIEVCDGSLALAFDALDDPRIVATSGWIWDSYGFSVPAELPGLGNPGCADVDGDGDREPIITDRILSEKG